MTAEGIDEMVDFKEEYLESDFEKIMVLAMKHVYRALRNLENDNQELRKRIDKLEGGN